MSKDKNTNLVWDSKKKRKKNKSSIYSDQFKEEGRDPKKKIDSTIPKERVPVQRKKRFGQSHGKGLYVTR